MAEEGRRVAPGRPDHVGPSRPAPEAAAEVQGTAPVLEGRPRPRRHSATRPPSPPCRPTSSEPAATLGRRRPPAPASWQEASHERPAETSDRHRRPTDPGAPPPPGRPALADSPPASADARVSCSATPTPTATPPSEPPARPGSAEMPATRGRPARLQLLGEIARGGMGAVLKGRDPDLSRDLAVKVLLEKHRDDPDLAPPLRRGGPDRRPAPAPRHRPGLPARHPRRPPALLHHEAGQGPHPRRAARRARHPGRRPAPVRRHLRAGLPDRRLRPLPRRDPPRPQAVERHGRRLRRGAGDGLGPGQGPGPRRARPPRPEDPSSPGETVVATARSGSAGSDLSRAGSVIGTPAYMPPEQARGEVDRVDTPRRRLRAWARSSARSSPAGRRTSAAPRPRSSARRRGATRPRPWPAIDASGADPELIALARDCLAAEPRRPPGRRRRGGRPCRGLPGRRRRAAAAGGGRAGRRGCPGGGGRGGRGRRAAGAAADRRPGRGGAPADRAGRRRLCLAGVGAVGAAGGDRAGRRRRAAARRRAAGRGPGRPAGPARPLGRGPGGGPRGRGPASAAASPTPALRAAGGRRRSRRSSRAAARPRTAPPGSPRTAPSWPSWNPIRG